MQFATKKINNEVVREVPQLTEKDTRPVKGANLFPEIYSNIFLCAKKKSGKTSTIFKILKTCCGSNTKIIVFCSTLHKDSSWETIQAWADHYGHPFNGNTSLKEDGVDLLDELVEGLEKKTTPAAKIRNILDSDSEDEEEKKPSRTRSPEYIIILDDLSNQLKSSSLTTLLKKNRHFKCKILISSQYLNDIPPESRKQMDYWILFKGHPKKKLLEIYQDADISVPFETFEAIYDFATEKPFSFLYIDPTDGTFRRNFNYQIEVPS